MTDEERAFMEYVKENTIYGFTFDDLKKLALILRELHIEPQDIKDTNKIVSEAVEYTIARYNDYIEKTVEDYFLNDGKEDKVDKKELSIRWGIRQGAKIDEIEKRREK